MPWSLKWRTNTVWPINTHTLLSWQGGKGDILSREITFRHLYFLVRISQAIATTNGNISRLEQSEAVPARAPSSCTTHFAHQGPALSVLLLLGGNLNHLRPPVMMWMCSKAALTSAPSRPAPHPSQCPAGEQEQQVHPQPREQRWPQLLRQVWCLPQAQHTHSRYQPHDCTPNLSKDKARASPHQSMAQAEFTLWHVPRSSQGDTIRCWQCRISPSSGRWM